MPIPHDGSPSTPPVRNSGPIARWQHASNVELLAHALADLTGLDLEPWQAQALAGALAPFDPEPGEADRIAAALAGVATPDAVSRADLRRLADRSQSSGPEMDYAWAAYKAAGFESLTAWQAFQAGIRAAADYRG